jgi:hypothetical protein
VDKQCLTASMQILSLKAQLQMENRAPTKPSQAIREQLQDSRTFSQVEGLPLIVMGLFFFFLSLIGIIKNHALDNPILAVHLFLGAGMIPLGIVNMYYAKQLRKLIDASDPSRSEGAVRNLRNISKFNMYLGIIWILIGTAIFWHIIGLLPLVIALGGFTHSALRDQKLLQLYEDELLFDSALTRT